MGKLDEPMRAAREVAVAQGAVPDRSVVLQDGNTLVLRLTETLVARVVTDREGPRQGLEWFAREIDVAEHLARGGAPVIPVHERVPPGPYEHLGYAINFWRYVQVVDAVADPVMIGRTLGQCHELLRSYPKALPELAIMQESMDLLDGLGKRGLFPVETLQLLHERLESSMRVLRTFPFQALHGDAHLGNLLNTDRGLLWTDWEDTFAGPVEWDVASVVWNARILDEDEEMVEAVFEGCREAGGKIDEVALKFSLVARAAVMSAWYPILYPEPCEERRVKLQRRLEWLKEQS